MSDSSEHSRRGLMIGAGVLAGGLSLGQWAQAQASMAGGTMALASTIDELREIDPSKTPAVYVLGYQNQSDGGGGVFVHDASVELPEADNGLNVVSNKAGGLWRRVIDGPINVRWFGGATVGADGIEAAYNAARETGINAVRWPGGRYLLDRTITVSLRFGTTYFDGVLIKADPNGSFTEIEDTYGRGVGKFVLWNNRDNAYHSYVGSVEFNGGRIANLVAIGTHRRGERYGEGGRASKWDFVSFNQCDYALFGQDHGASRIGPVGFASSYTGTMFSVFRVFPSSRVGFELHDTHGDDLHFGSLQLNGHGTNFLNQSHVSAGSVYMRGQSIKQTGLRLKEATFVASSIYVEHEYGMPILLEADSSLSSSCLKVGGGGDTEFGQSAAVVLTGKRIWVEITEHFKNATARAIEALVLLKNAERYSFRTVIVKRGYTIEAKPPIAYDLADGRSSPADSLICYAAGGEYRGRRKNDDVRWRRVNL